MLELGFRVKFACIQNFELILNILEHSKPSISSLKQPGSLPIGKNSNMSCNLSITNLVHLGKGLLHWTFGGWILIRIETLVS